MANCNRCGFDLKNNKEQCLNCGEINRNPYTYYRVDAQNKITYWIEQMRHCDMQTAVNFALKYRVNYPGCPVRVRKVTEEEVSLD